MNLGKFLNNLALAIIIVNIVSVVILIGIAFIKFIQGGDAIKYLIMALLLSVIAGIFVWISEQING